MGDGEYFNLIIIHEPGLDNYRWTLNQLNQLLESNIEITDSRQSVIFAKVKDPHKIAKELREKLKDTSTPIIKIIPVDYVVDPLINEVESVIKKIASLIPENATFRITLSGHLYEVSQGLLNRLHTMDSIKRLAEYVNRSVNLKNPDYIIFIKVIKLFKHIEKAAISLLKKEELMRIGGEYS